MPRCVCLPRLYNCLRLVPSRCKNLKKTKQLVMNFCITGTRALNRTQFSALSAHSNFGEHIALVTVFTTYNTSADHSKSKVNDLVTVGNLSYNKVERSLAILNVFINFIQVLHARGKCYFYFHVKISKYCAVI